MRKGPRVAVCSPLLARNDTAPLGSFSCAAPIALELQSCPAIYTSIYHKPSYALSSPLYVIEKVSCRSSSWLCEASGRSSLHNFKCPGRCFITRAILLWLSGSRLILDGSGMKSGDLAHLARLQFAKRALVLHRNPLPQQQRL